MSAFIIRSEIKRTNLFLSLRCSRVVGSDRHFSPFSWLVSFPQRSGRVQTRPGEHVWLHGLTLCGANGGRYYFRVLYLGTAYCSTYRAQWLLMAIDGVCWLSDMRWAWLHTVLTKTFMWDLWKLYSGVLSWKHTVSVETWSTLHLKQFIKRKANHKKEV